jgi:hypothetical protein
MFAATAAAAPPANTAPPTISGTPTVGQTLTASDGTWSNTPTSFAYQWLRCNGGGNNCADIANGTQKTYTLVDADSGNTIRVRVTPPMRRVELRPVRPDGASRLGHRLQPQEHDTTHDLGDRKGRTTAQADPGTWSGNPTSFALSVATMRRRRRHLFGHRWLGRPNLRHPDR